MEAAPRILVVDDEPKICEFLGVALRKEGYLVDSVLDGAAALTKLRDCAYDLVISDIVMLGMDGFELVRRVKQSYQDLPVVIITGYATLETAVKALRNGADDYVTKPFKIAEMRRVLGRVLEKARLALENRRLMEELTAANAQLTRHREALRDAVRTATRKLRVSNEDLRERVRELAMLNEIATHVASELDLDKLLGICVNQVAEKLTASKASVMLREDGWLVVRASHGPKEQYVLDRRKDLAEELADMVTNSGKPVLVEDVAADPRFSRNIAGAGEATSAVCVPITCKQDNLGVICATEKPSRGAFTQADMELLSTIANQVAPAIENAGLYRKLKRSAFSVVRSFVAAMEAKDRHLSGHAHRVSRYSLELGKAVGLGHEDLLVLERASQLHDIGKIGVSDVILDKRGPLTSEEYEVVKKHPVWGEQIIRPLAFLEAARPIIRGHHERPDGTGYPDGKKKKEIGLLSRMISVADAFDAMTHSRPYRPAKSPDEARREISHLRDTQFDQEVATVFCDVVIPQTAAEFAGDDRPS